MPEPFSASRIRAAATKLEDRYLRVADDVHVEPQVAALLRRIADAVHNLEVAGYTPDAEPEMDRPHIVPELRALVEAIEGASG